MAPNGGHLLVGKTMRILRLAIDRAGRVLRDKIPQVTQPFEVQVEPAYARISTKGAVNRVTALRYGQSRSFTTHAETVRHFSSSSQRASRPPRSSYPQSRTGHRVSQLTSRAPFASTLRPNLTGGTLSRSAGGYNLGAGRVGGARFFSHSPASSAEVIQNVSQAVRAFWLSGQKAHFHGYDPKTGEKRFRAMSGSQDKARQALDMSHANALGSFIDFKVNPTITAVGPLSAVRRAPSTSASCDYETLQYESAVDNQLLLTTLEVDFSRALKDLAAIMNDIRRLSALGSLPLILIDQNTLRVRFPGCDRDTVEDLCRELGIRRGIVGQDPDFDEQCGTEMALLFPFAPCEAGSEDYRVVFENENHRPTKKPRQKVDWEAMLSPAQSLSPRPASRESLEDAHFVENPWLSSPSGYSSLQFSDNGDPDVSAMFFQPTRPSKQFVNDSNHKHMSQYEGLEGIYRFIEECDGARR